MTAYPEPAFAGIDIPWLLIIIVGSLIAQAVKNIREKKRPSQRDATPREKPRIPVFTEAQAELEEFLESLSGESEQPAAPQEPASQPVAPQEPPRTTVVSRKSQHSPPPVPLEALPARPQREAVQPRPIPRFELPESPVISAQVPRALPESRRSPGRRKQPGMKDVAPRATASNHQEIETMRLAIGNDLVDHAALRKAILLQEILNKPLALRTDKDATDR